MTSRNKKRDPKRLATRKPPTPRLRLTVVTHPQTARGRGGSSLSLHAEIQTLRAAVLYADEIDVVSPAAEMLSAVKAFTEASETPALDVLSALDPKTMERLGARDGEEMRQVLPLLPLLQNEGLAEFLELSGQEAVEEYRRISAVFKAAMATSSEQMRATANQMFQNAGGPELTAAVKTGIVRLCPLLRPGDEWDTDVLVERYVEEITALLEDGRRHMLLDQGTAKMARALIREEQVRLSPLALPNAQESLVGTGVIARLPTFGETPIDELLDLRRDLIAPLSRYRRAVATLGDKMRVSPIEADATVEVDHIYLHEVIPALEEMREHLAEHGLVREFARAVGADLKAFIAGGIATPGLIVGAQAVTDLAAVATAGLAAMPGIMGTGSVVFKAVEARRQALTEAAGRELYYLYELDRRMA